MDDKIIVSNRAALIAKYGAGGVTRIKKAIDALIAADANRGIKSRLVYVDDAAAMKAFKGSAVTDHTSARQNKEAIDAIFRATDPEYLTILGALDVVPHQDMTNPTFDPPHDPDKYAYGDLPYACDAPYARDIATFKGPTRVVGRLPDLTNADEPSHLLALIAIAAKHQSRDVTDYGKYFGLSTHSWRKSTELSLFNVFGNSAALTIAPPSGPTHPRQPPRTTRSFHQLPRRSVRSGFLRREGQFAAGIAHQQDHRVQDQAWNSGGGRVLLRRGTV